MARGPNMARQKWQFQLETLKISKMGKYWQRLTSWLHMTKLSVHLYQVPGALVPKYPGSH